MIKIPPIPDCEVPNGHIDIRRNKYAGSFEFTCYTCQKQWRLIRVWTNRRSSWRIASEALLSANHPDLTPAKIDQ